ncbi:MAG: radical SAM family heme chaperone HemW [Elusimicrobiales bacterium]|nr:radical SAM family heme chaperone HemW [Elusimicrobiales bacterium]
MFQDFFSVYIHIPFCKKKCNYCDFYSITSIDLEKNFLNALKNELTLRKKYLTKVSSIYIGGGTPSCLSIDGIKFLFNLIENNISLKELKEITFEANPESLTKEKIDILKYYKVNRISIGLQSTNNEELNFLGRIHSYQDFVEKYKMIHKNFLINVDLIYGLPNQDFENFKNNVYSVINLIPNHISLYALEIHNNTPFFGEIEVDFDTQANIYIKTIELLENYNYKQYEVSNFSFKGLYNSYHNINYWRRGNFIGFGPSASSCIYNIRLKNISDIHSYISSLNNGKIELDYVEELDYIDIMNEKLMLSLRTCDGIAENSDVYYYFKNEIDRCYKDGYLEKSFGKYRFKKEYFFVSNSILASMIKSKE